MGLFCFVHPCRTLFMTFLILRIKQEVSSSTFTFVNKCDFIVWPGILAGAGSPKLTTTGFELLRESSRSLQAPTGWSGRFWGRTGCNFNSSDSFICATGDCGSGEVECSGTGATPPATLAEFTLGSGSLDFYDVSLVDGYNLPVVIEGTSASETCGSTGCATDVNRQCPTELRTEHGGACKSACEAFGTPEYCCRGSYNSPSTCQPSVYSQMFKSACPRSYSYAYDDSTSTFTCFGEHYTITFCPSSPSLKSTTESTPTTVSVPRPGSKPESLEEEALPASWLANLATATGDSDKTHPPPAVFVFLIMPLFLIFSRPRRSKNEL